MSKQSGKPDKSAMAREVERLLRQLRTPPVEAEPVEPAKQPAPKTVQPATPKSPPSANRPISSKSAAPLKPSSAPAGTRPSPMPNPKAMSVQSPPPRPAGKKPLPPRRVMVGPAPRPRGASGHAGDSANSPDARAARSPNGDAHSVLAAIPTPMGVWSRVALGALLATAVTQWPYQVCGLPLVGYLIAVLMVLVAAVWAGHASWRARMGTAHVIAIAILLAGVALGAAQVLPRVGYAPVVTTWGCVP